VNLCQSASVAGFTTIRCRKTGAICVRSGLNVIGNRCDALNRFTGVICQAARLPAPKLQPMLCADWIGRIVRLEHTRWRSRLQKASMSRFRQTPDQLEQLLINNPSQSVDAS